MSCDTIHTLAGILTPTRYYSQIEDYSISPTVSEMLARPNGLPNPMFRGVRGLKPEVTFRTTQLASLIADCGVTCADFSAGNTDLQFRKVQLRGLRYSDATANHTRLRIAKGWMYWRSITLADRGESSADVRLCATYDGTNVPIAPTGSVIITGAPTAAEQYSLGPVSINQNPIDGVSGVQISSGWTTIEKGSASEGYDTFYALWQADPVVTITGLSFEEWSAYGLVGGALSALVVYGRAVMPDAAGGLPYVAGATPSHLKLTATYGLIGIEQSRNSEGIVETALKISLRAATAAGATHTLASGQAIT